MKRRISLALAVMCVTILGSFVAPAPAHAAVVSCQPRIGSTGAWPDREALSYMGGTVNIDYVQFCGTTTATDANGIASALSSILTHNSTNGGFDSNKAGTILKKAPVIHNVPGIGAVTAPGATFWLFNNSKDFVDTCVSRPNDFGLDNSMNCPKESDLDDPAGSTLSDIPTGHALFSVVFKDQIIVPGKNIAQVTAHEAGHWLDGSSTYQTLLGFGSATKFASDGSNFAQNLAVDWNAFNSLTPQCGTTGAHPFTSQKDQNDTFICSGTNGTGSTLNSGFSGNNQNVVKQAWPHYFGNTSTNKEFFAQSFEKTTQSNWNGSRSPDAYIPSFACTQKLIDSIARYGVVPGRRLQQLTGTATVGDQITLKFNNAGTIHTVATYTVSSTNLADVATGLANKITTDPILPGQGVSATADGLVLAVVNNGQTISAVITGVPGHAATESIGQTFLDWPNANCHRF